MRRFRVPDLPGPDASVALDANTAHHLGTVIRARLGDRVQVFDGTGHHALAEVTALDPLVLVQRGEATDAKPTHRVHLVIGLPKNQPMDLAVRMATEAGVTDIHPVLVARSVAKGDRGDRWARIAQSAAQQCGRGDIPTVHPLRKLAQVFEQLPPARFIALPGAPKGTAAAADCAVLIGPAGGFTDAEVALAMDAGCHPLGLGAWVFRAETAAAVAVALLSP